MPTTSSELFLCIDETVSMLLDSNFSTILMLKKQYYTLRINQYTLEYYIIKIENWLETKPKMSKNHDFSDVHLNIGSSERVEPRRNEQTGEKQFDHEAQRGHAHQQGIHPTDLLVKIEQAKIEATITDEDSEWVDKSVSKKRASLMGVGFVFLIPISIVVGLVSNVEVNSNSYHPQNASPYIVKRNYVIDRTYYNSYEVTSEQQNYTLKAFYDFIAVVTSTSNDSTQFVSSFLKNRQERVEQNGTSTVVNFSDGNPFLSILQNNSLANSFPSDAIDSNFLTDTPIDLMSPLQANQSNSTALSMVLPVFRFTLLANGQISQFTFPTGLEKDILALFGNVVKLFSPLLDFKTYAEGQTVGKVKLTSNGITETYTFLGEELLFNSSNSSNSTNDTSPQQTYQQSNNYEFESVDGGVILNNSASISTSDATQNSNETGSQSNQFDENGNLLHAGQNSVFELRSVQQPPDPKSSVMNFDLNFTVNQRAEMNKVSIFTASRVNVQKLQGLIGYYQEQNQTMTTDPEGMINFVKEIDQNSTNSSIRLLLQPDGSLSIIKQSYKEYLIASRNILGYKIALAGYTLYSLNLYEDPNNRYRLSPKVKAEAGMILTMGYNRYYWRAIKYSNMFPPISFIFTLEQIEFVMNVSKIDFGNRINDLSNLVSNLQFNDDLLPKLLNITTLLSEVLNLVVVNQNINRPIQVITQVLQILIDIKDIIDTRGRALLRSKNDIIRNVSNQLYQFANTSYSEALTVFEQSKNLLNSLKREGEDFLTSFDANFTQLDLPNAQQRIRSVISADIYADYERQMRKAQSIIDFIGYVQQSGTNYTSYLNQSLYSHKRDFLKFVKGVVDLFFANQSRITDKIYNLIQQRQADIGSNVEYFKGLVAGFDTGSLNSSLSNYFRSVVNTQLLGSEFRDTWYATTTALSGIANAIKDQRVECCEHRQWWEVWLPDCIRYNNAFGLQGAEPDVYAAVKQAMDMVFYNIHDTFFNFTRDSLNAITQNPNKIVDMFNTIKQQGQGLRAALDSISSIGEQINSRLSGANEISNNMGCGSRTPLDNYIQYLGILKSFVNSYQGKISSVASNYDMVVAAFSPDNYNLLLNNFVIVGSVGQFMVDYTRMEDYTKSFIHDLRLIAVSFNPEQFVKSDEVAKNVTRLYSKVEQGLTVVCDNIEQQNQTINSIRQDYRNRYEEVKDVQSSLMGNQLNQIKYFLDKASRQMFSTYLTIPFCADRNIYLNDTSVLYPDIDRFPILYTLYNNITKLMNQNQISISALRGKIQGLTTRLYQLFTPMDFNNFINSTQLLAHDVESLLVNISLDFSRLKEEGREVRKFEMAPLQNLTTALNLFVSSPFTLRTDDMFQNLAAMSQLATRAIGGLSYDIIAATVVWKDVISYYQRTVSDYNNGMRSVQSEFSYLCQSFIDLASTTGQEHLNQINNRFKILNQTLNTTIFINITTRMNELINKYRNYIFSNRNLLYLKDKSLQELTAFVMVVGRARDRIFTKMNSLTGSINLLISKIQIGNLNAINELGMFMEQKFNSLLEYFPTLIAKIADQNQIIGIDFRKVLNFTNFTRAIQREIEQRYNDTTSSIQDKVNATQNYFTPDSDIFRKLINSSTYAFLQRLGADLLADFGQIWNLNDLKLSILDSLLSQVSANQLELIQQLGDYKQVLLRVQSSVQSRINVIQAEFLTTTNKLANLKELIFILLKAELGGTVKGCINNILQQVDLIFNQDLRQIDPNSTLGQRVPLIGELTRVLVNFYRGLIPDINNFKVKAEYISRQIDRFLASEISKKIQKLKDGLLYIRASTDLTPNLGTEFVLWQDKYYSVDAPMVTDFRIFIFTKIGVFVITINLNYTMDIDVYMVLKDYRSIDFRVIFEVSLKIDIRFGYLCLILEFGVYASGKIVRAQVTAALEMNNILPLQLVQAIADVPQIRSSNIVTVNINVDLAVYAFGIEIGVYLIVYYLEIIWKWVRICLFGGCISFHVPAGFWIRKMRWNLGFQLNEREMMKQRVYSRQLIRWQY